MVDGACPGDGDAYATRTGQIRLAVEAPGPWTAVVEQEVDTPLDEPPLPEMQAATARVLARGPFRNVDRMGKGEVTLYRLADGRSALRLENFQIPINTDLFVWTEPVAGLKNSAAMFDAPHTVVAALKSTTGNQNYVVPATVAPEQIKSIVIWCQIQQFAYVAGDLQAS
ncbi:MAG: DM13 domain-containing protein [Candidatus Dormibacteria bacterium]